MADTSRNRFGRWLDYPAWGRYAVAALITVAFVLVRAGLDPWLGSGLQFIMAVAAVLLSAFLCGTGPAILTVILSTIAVDYWFMEPRGQFKFNLQGLPGVIVFNLLSAGIIWTVHALRREETRAEAKSEQLEGILASITEAFFTLDRDWHFTYANPQANQVFSRLKAASESVLGKTLWETFPPIIGTDVERDYHRAMEADSLVNTEMFYEPTKNWFQVNLYPSRDGLSVFFRDITSQRAAQESLRQSETLLRTVTNESRVGLVMLDRARQYLFANPTYAEILGLPSADIIGRRVPELLGQLYDQIGPRLDRAFAGERVSYELHQAVHPRDGSERFYEVLYEPRELDSASPYVVVVITDITTRKRVEQALRQNRERFDLVSEAAQVGFWFCDLPFDKLNWDNRSKEHFWLPPETEVTIETFYERLHPEDRERTRREIEKSVANKTHYNVEYRTVAPDGREKWIRALGQTFYDASGRPVHFDGITLDITESKRNEVALRRSEEKYRNLLNSIDEGFCVIEMLFDRHGAPIDYRFLEINDAFARQSGLPHALGRRIRDLLPQLEEHWFQIYGQVALTGQPVRFENFTEKMGRRWFDVYASRVGDPAERKVAVLFNDISERKLAEEALRKAQGELREYAATLELTVNQRTAQLREKIGELETFSYSVSHDMRAPLRSMQGFAQILREEFAGQWQPEPQDLLLRIEKAAERLDHLIQDMLTYSQVTRGETALSSINLQEVVNQVMQAYPGFRVAQIEIAVSSVRVQGNLSALTQCISNLLANAVKFVVPGRQPRVKIWTEPSGESIRLWIEDNGIGIPPVFHEKIFELFTRVHDRSDYEGTGIGLSIVKKAIEKMGGQVGVKSELGQGSRFWLELPKA